MNSKFIRSRILKRYVGGLCLTPAEHLTPVSKVWRASGSSPNIGLGSLCSVAYGYLCLVRVSTLGERVV